MHETGLARNVIEIVERAIQGRAISKLSEVVLEIGEASGVQIEALRFAFSVLIPGTLLEDAEIKYLTSPLLLHCHNCDKTYQASLQDHLCPNCQNNGFDIVSGRSLTVKSISGVSNDRE